MSRFVCISIFAACFLAAASGHSDTRMQVTQSGTAVYPRPAADAQSVGQVSAGDIVFMTKREGDWAAISPPGHIGVWLNKDFVEGNRVVAKSIQVRSGPGIQYDIVGTLSRGAPVMPLEESGEWCKISPPSSVTLWVKAANLTEVAARTSTPPPESESAKPAERPAPPKVESTQPTQTASAQPTPRPSPTSRSVEQPTTPPAQTLRPATAVPRPTQPAAQPSPRPTPAESRRPIEQSTSPSLQRTPIRPPKPTPVPAPGVMSAPSESDLDIPVDPALVQELVLSNHPQQGTPIQVEGQLRQRPLSSASPSRYLLMGQENNNPVWICHIHGDSALLRPYAAQQVSIRGRQYWVEQDSSLPVVVVSQIVPLAPADNPIRFQGR